LQASLHREGAQYAEMRVAPTQLPVSHRIRLTCGLQQSIGKIQRLTLSTTHQGTGPTGRCLDALGKTRIFVRTDACTFSSNSLDTGARTERAELPWTKHT
jgi:hypothetical protein